MACDEIHMNDIGVEFKCTVQDCDDAVNISGATTKQLIYQKPNGSLLTKDASFYTDGSDGILTYTTVSGDLNACGMWALQGFVIMSTGEYHSDIKSFKVHRNLE